MGEAKGRLALTNGRAFAVACIAGSCFFAAHLLRVQERTVHHSEQQTKLLEKITAMNLSKNDTNLSCLHDTHQNLTNRLDV